MGERPFCAGRVKRCTVKLKACLVLLYRMSSQSYRENSSRFSFLIMGVDVLLNFLVSMLPMMGVTALKMNLPETNSVIIFAIALGFVVWLLFLSALLLRRAGYLTAYHSIAMITQIAWFIDSIGFLYGMYKSPLLPSGA